MRYSRQIVFEKIGVEGQEKINGTNVTILGLGAIGSKSAELLTRAGIGSLTLIDRDIVEESNLQRQSLFTEEDINQPKALVAKARLEKINSNTKIRAFFKDINNKNIEDYVRPAMALDCTDNMQTRFLLNEFCFKEKIPWIYTAIIESTGMLFSIMPEKTPCLTCIFNEINQPLDSCDVSGIINTIAPLASSIQATEAIKYIINKPTTKELLYFDVWKNKIEKIKVKKQIGCPTCNSRFSYINGKKTNDAIKLCGTNSYQIQGPKLKLKEVAGKLEKIDKVILNDYCLIFKDLTIFSDGRVLIKAPNDKQARSAYTKYIGY
ncbi:ThiF family adenylyltransferase [Candidatus Woesearchaeota archaeon]|nr:ThiF family adenylyltransferase [Candidatus Woesearchaeota archaeon]